MASATQTPGVAPHLLSSVSNAGLSLAPQDTVAKPRDVATTFNYYKDPADGSAPVPNYVNKPSTYVREPTVQQQVVHDIRGSEHQHTLDTTGFQVVRHESAEKDFSDDEHIKSVYYPETEELLKKATGASKIFIFDHTIRRNVVDDRGLPIRPPTEPEATPSEAAAQASAPLRGPVRSVHIDQSYGAAPNRVTHHLPDEAETLLKGRFQIINVWRPIKTILKDPLGLAAANTVLDDELVPIKLIYPNREGETYAVRPAKESRTDGGHKWHYLSKQTPEEVTLIKCFDSKTDGRARRVPHSSFIDKEFEDQIPRESIEVRTLVFHPDDIN